MDAANLQNVYAVGLSAIRLYHAAAAVTLTNNPAPGLAARYHAAKSSLVEALGGAAGATSGAVDIQEAYGLLHVATRLHRAAQGVTLTNNPAGAVVAVYDAAVAYTLDALAAGSALPALEASLAGFRLGGVRAAEVLLIGDSTTDNSGPRPPFGYMAERTDLAHSVTGGLTYGVNFVNHGTGGATMLQFNSNGITRGLADAVSRNPRAYVVSYGINDVNTGADLATLTTRLRALVNGLLAGRPNTPIILQTPSTFTSDDPNNANNIVPISAAQARSDALGLAYAAVVGEWPGKVVHISKRSSPTEVCKPLAESLMVDPVHRSEAGYDKDSLQIATLLRAKGWPFIGPQPDVDPFESDRLIVLRGATDLTGRHTVGAGLGTVGVSGDYLSFNGTSNCKVLGNNADWQKLVGPQGAPFTIDIDIVPTARTVGWGQQLLVFGASPELVLGLGPSSSGNTLRIGTEQGPPVTLGVRTRLRVVCARDAVSFYKDGVRFSVNWITKNFTPSLSDLHLGSTLDGWEQSFYSGLMRFAIWSDNIVNHEEQYTLVDWQNAST